MYNNASSGALAVTGGTGAMYLGWWAVAAVIVGISILAILRYRAGKARRSILAGE